MRLETTEYPRGTGRGRRARTSDEHLVKKPSWVSTSQLVLPHLGTVDAHQPRAQKNSNGLEGSGKASNLRMRGEL